MPFKKYLLLPFLFYTSLFFAQQTIQHKVEKGETVYSLAKKYQVKPEAILELNPKAKKGLQLQMVLQIPTAEKKEGKEKMTTITHEVLPKETLYGISKKYQVSIDKIKEQNPIIEKEGLEIGLKLTITTSVSPEQIAEKPAVVTAPKPEVVKNNPAPKEEVANTEEIIHEVLPKETKYGIAKKYGISVANIEAWNPNSKKGLAIGDKLVIKNSTASKEIKVAPEETKPKESAVVKNNTEDVASTKPQPVKEQEKPKSQIKLIGKVESDKNEEIVVVKPQQEEEEEEVEVKPELPIVTVAPLSEESSSKADFLIEKASENIGVRYRSGGTSSAGFDCSGLMINTFSQIDMKLPRSSREMAVFGNRIDRSQAQKGDLIFFATMGKGRVSHVGMVIEVEEDEIKFIHSSTSAGVIVSSTKEPYYAKRFVQVNRVLE